MFLTASLSLASSFSTSGTELEGTFLCRIHGWVLDEGLSHAAERPSVGGWPGRPLRYVDWGSLHINQEGLQPHEGLRPGPWVCEGTCLISHLCKHLLPVLSTSLNTTCWTEGSCPLAAGFEAPFKSHSQAESDLWVPPYSKFQREGIWGPHLGLGWLSSLLSNISREVKSPRTHRRPTVLLFWLIHLSLPLRWCPVSYPVFLLKGVTPAIIPPLIFLVPSVILFVSKHVLVSFNLNNKPPCL